MIYALIVSDSDGLVDRVRVRSRLDDALASVPARLRPDPETWGTSDREIAARQAAELQFGPAL